MVNLEDDLEEQGNFNIETKLSKDKRMECRNIVKTVKEFGVSQRQMLYLIQLFAFELEDRNVMNSIVDAVKKNREKVEESIIQLPDNSVSIIT